MLNLRKSGFAALLPALILAMCLGIIGCPGMQVTSGEPAKSPAGCEKSVLWSQGFMPLGPGVLVAGVSTALIIEPQAAPAIRLAALTAYNTLEKGSLVEVSVALRQDRIGRFFVPVITLLEQWFKQGALQGVELQLDACDRQILKDLIRDVALSAGANPGDFK